MRKLKAFTCSLLLATTPSLLVYPQEVPFQIEKVTNEDKPAVMLISYDAIIRLLDEIESGELERRNPSHAELERIKHFLVFLAKQGALPDQSEESLSLDDDIEELLQGSSYENDFSPWYNYQYTIFPSHGEFVLCGGWVKKQCHHFKKFCKNHKKGLIIGAAVIVAAAVVVVAVVASSAAAGAAVAGAAGAAASSGSDKSKGDPSPSAEIPSAMAATEEAPTLKSAIDDQISSFKENIVQQQFFQLPDPSLPHQELPWVESGRALGSLFAHDSFNHLQQEIPYHPGLSHEIQDLGSKYSFPNNVGHPEIDHNFGTDYTPYVANNEIDFNSLSYQVRGESALAHGYYEQAVQDFGKAIEMNPTSPIPYLERGVAHFGLGQYDRSLEDYRQFTSQAQTTLPLSIPDFSLGFAKGLPQGIYDSGSGLFLFVSDLVLHPVNTGAQMWDALSTLSNLARSEEWSALSEVLAPEIHQLVTEWDTLPSEKRGELAGYAFGKYGADILIPGALTKVVARGLKGAQELSTIYKGLQTAEQTLLLESVAGLENGAKIAEVVRAGQTTAFLGEELGFTMQEMSQLKQAGKLEAAIDSVCESWLAKSPSEAYVAAKNGGKHARIITEFSGKPVKEIQKSIRSYEKLIVEHKDKIANPSKYCPDWDTFHPNRQKALVDKIWPTEIQCYTEQMDILQTILNQR